MKSDTQAGLQSDDHDICSVLFPELCENILAICELRNDTWGLEVKGRLQHYSNLIPVEAVYHRKCHELFSSMRERESKDVITDSILDSG